MITGKLLATAGILLALVSLSFLPAAAQSYTVTDLGTLGGKTASGMAINSLGDVAGFSLGKSGIQHAFFWSPSTGMLDLGVLHPTDPSSTAWGLNNSGQVVGTSGGSAFLWTQSGGMQDLGSLGGGGSFAYGINNLGQVVGGSLLSDSFTGHAFLWTTTGGMQDLGTLSGVASTAFAINDAGQVVGYADVSDAEVPAFLWTESDGMQSLGTLGGASSVATAINSSGQVAGYSATATSPQVPFLWDPTHGMRSLAPSTSGFTSWATGINSFGQVVGNWEPASLGNGIQSNTVPPKIPPSHEFLWTNARGLQTLNALLTNRNILVVAAYAINSKGQITGLGNNGHAIVLTPTK